MSPAKACFCSAMQCKMTCSNVTLAVAISSAGDLLRSAAHTVPAIRGLAVSKDANIAISLAKHRSRPLRSGAYWLLREVPDEPVGVGYVG